MGTTMRVHDRVHEARTRGGKLHPVGITCLGHDHEVSWAWPCTFMGAAASFGGARAKYGRVTMKARDAGMRLHPDGMARSQRVHEPSWIEESTFMATALSFMAVPFRHSCHRPRLVGAFAHPRDRRARRKKGSGAERRSRGPDHDVRRLLERHGIRSSRILSRTASSSISSGLAASFPGMLAIVRSAAASSGASCPRASRIEGAPTPMTGSYTRRPVAFVGDCAHCLSRQRPVIVRRP